MVTRNGECPNCLGIRRQFDRFAQEEAAVGQHLTDFASSLPTPPSSPATAAADNEIGGARAFQFLTDRQRFLAMKAALDDVLLRR